MNASISHHQADISLQIAFLLLIKLILQLHASFFVFSLKHEYCKKSFHLQVNVTFPPLFFVLCCFYSFHIHFFPPIRLILLSSHFSSVLLSATFLFTFQWVFFHHRRYLEEKQLRSVFSALLEASHHTVVLPSKRRG